MILCVISCFINELLIFILCAYYGRRAPMALAFRQPSINISTNVFISVLFASSVVVNKIIIFSFFLGITAAWSQLEGNA